MKKKKKKKPTIFLCKHWLFGWLATELPSANSNQLPDQNLYQTYSFQFDNFKT